MIYLGLAAFALTWVVGLPVGVDPIAILWRALAGAAAFGAAGAVIGAVIENSLEQALAQEAEAAADHEEDNDLSDSQ
jgi:predicted PurR-regulated permease PerM